MNINFEIGILKGICNHIGCCTVDPGTDAYDPRPLIPYVESLKIPYHFQSQRIIDRAKECEARC